MLDERPPRDYYPLDRVANRIYRVAIRTRVRGDRQRWLDMARTNAETGLALRVASLPDATEFLKTRGVTFSESVVRWV